MFSERFASGHNVHSVYHSTHQLTSGRSDIRGFINDALRMSAVNGGSYTRTAILLCQLWIDSLTSAPHSRFLQIGVSEGGTHVNAAIRLMIQCGRKDLVDRLSIINLCPAYFIMPDKFAECKQLTVLNFVKLEDKVINPWGINTNLIGHSPHIIVVPHWTTQDNPHFQLSHDFQKVVKPYIDQFLATGNILPTLCGE
eukprot:gene2905-3338_t